eukprot:GFYU01015631.1.p1 GENE.GFYU01015631.1~~GFYU01015631.1.p1  ORF type:complete len:107 (-),score=29.33 GFYU01015631.1:169-489(-)
MDWFAEENPEIGFVHAAPGVVKTRWGTEMPWVIRGMIRFMQLFATSPATCAEHMCDAFMNDKWKPGFHLMSPSATEAKTTKLHSTEARDFVRKHTRDTIDAILNKQ